MCAVGNPKSGIICTRFIATLTLIRKRRSLSQRWTDTRAQKGDRERVADVAGKEVDVRLFGQFALQRAFILIGGKCGKAFSFTTT